MCRLAAPRARLGGTGPPWEHSPLGPLNPRAPPPYPLPEPASPQTPFPTHGCSQGRAPRAQLPPTRPLDLCPSPPTLLSAVARRILFSYCFHVSFPSSRILWASYWNLGAPTIPLPSQPRSWGPPPHLLPPVIPTFVQLSPFPQFWALPTFSTGPENPYSGTSVPSQTAVLLKRMK